MFEETFICGVNHEGTAFIEDGMVEQTALCDLYLYLSELCGKKVEITIKEVA